MRSALASLEHLLELVMPWKSRNAMVVSNLFFFDGAIFKNFNFPSKFDSFSCFSFLQLLISLFIILLSPKCNQNSL